MVAVTGMSRERAVVSAPPPTAATWKASRYRLVGDSLRPDYLEATPGAVWSRWDPFRYYEPLANRSEPAPIPPPHKPLATMSDLAGGPSSPPRRSQQKGKQLYDRIEVFAHVYGFLGFFGEAFATPLLPARADPSFSWVAPDTLIDQAGKLREIDPKTEGKQLLQELLEERDGPFRWARVKLKGNNLAWPGELRFPILGVDRGEFGLDKPSSGWQHSGTRSYDEVRELFGISFVLDVQARGGVSIVATREPLNFWLAELRKFWPMPPGPAYFDQALEDVSPRAVANEEGGLASSWRCPSLLKAAYLMLYLDEISSVRLLKCQAPNCPEHYRAGPLSRDSLYCPPPPGREQSKCASRASSAMYRERQRKSRLKNASE
jgi:hypothetical protein